MRVIPPLTLSSTSITAAMLTSTTAPEAVSTVFSVGSTYSIGDQVYVAGSAGLQHVYQSLQNSNTGHTPTTLSTDSWWQYMGDIYQPYAGGTTYALNDYVQDNTNHLIYQSLVGSNTGNALTDTTKWLLIGPTNRWMMFDLLRNTQTDVPSPLTVVLTPGERVNSLALFGLQANSVTITATSVEGGGTVYTHTEDLDTREVLDWYDYFFLPFGTRETVVVFDIPPYSDIVVTISLTATGMPVLCGGIVIGNFVYLGQVEATAQADVLNFSTVTRDSFGNATMVQRRNVPTTKQKVWADKSRINKIRLMRDTLNALPAVWSGIDDDTDGYFESLFILGFYRQFIIDANYPDTAVLELTLEEI